MLARLGLEPAEGAVANPALAEARHALVDPRLAALGARLVYPADVPVEATLARLGFATATPADYAAHRVALGIADTTEITDGYPLEANFEMLHGVDFKKGCYVGQVLTARMKLKGGLRRRILPVSGLAPLPAAGTPVTADGIELGPMIAACGAHGLALLRPDRLADAKEDAIRAQDVQLSIHWPSWLPR